MDDIELGSVMLDGVSYPTRIVDVPDYGIEIVSTEDLNNRLFKRSGGYISAEAIRLDEEIFFYVPEKELRTLSDDELAAFITRSL